MTAKFTPPKDDQAAKPQEQGGISPFARWFVDTRARLEMFLCDDATLERMAERVAVRRSYEERFSGRVWSAGEVEQISNVYGRQLTDDQAKAMRDRILMLRAKRDEIAERLVCTDWAKLRERAIRHLPTVTELAGMKWIAYLPQPERKPVDDRGMAERQRLAEEAARSIR